MLPKRCQIVGFWVKKISDWGGFVLLFVKMFGHELKISILSDDSPAKYYLFLFARFFLRLLILSKIGLKLEIK